MILDYALLTLDEWIALDWEHKAMIKKQENQLVKGIEEDQMRQVIIARKDLQMSPGKLAAQCCHASVAFLSKIIKDGNITGTDSIGYNEEKDMDEVVFFFESEIREDIYEEWLNGIFTKTICEARNRNHLMKAAAIADELGLKEGQDYFLIKDNCLTELEPEEVGTDGIGRTLTCIGFRPLPDDIAHAISKKYQLYS